MNLITPRCLPDGAVARDGEVLAASRPCNWEAPTSRGADGAEPSGLVRCAGGELLSAIEHREVGRRELQVVLVRHAEDIGWSEPFAPVRTVYEKPGPEHAVLPAGAASAGATAAASAGLGAAAGRAVRGACRAAQSPSCSRHVSLKSSSRGLRNRSSSAA